jgi:hypothetical protein
MSADLHENAVLLQEYLTTLPHPTVHVVGHSLGNIVIRALFHYFPRQRPGRIVMLAPPNRGSIVAERLAEAGVGRAVAGRALLDIVAGAPRHWTPPERDIGVVSGTVSFGLGRLVTRIPLPNDGVVSVAETAFATSKAQLTLPVTHTGIILSDPVAQAVAHFLRHGRFD